jgi:hypothetical protein
VGADVCAQVPDFYRAERDGQRWWTLAGAAGLLIPVRNRDGRIVARKALPVLEGLRPQQVVLAFDADWRTNPQVAHALGQAAFALGTAGYEVQVENWDPALGKGIDDLLATGHTHVRQSSALAFGAAVRGQARIWTGQLPTVAAEEVPSWH